jgi:septal ring-binding cell division protein DamX
MSGRRVCGAEVYSVFYGEYASRKAALEAKNDLPEVLRKISPIPRSVGGILKEIQRLETES